MPSTVLRQAPKAPIPFQIYLCPSIEAVKSHNLYSGQTDAIEAQFKYKHKKALLQVDGSWHWIQLLDAKNASLNLAEHARKKAADAIDMINQVSASGVEIRSDFDETIDLAYAEGLSLANYQFLKYSSKADKKANALAEIFIPKASQDGIDWFQSKLEGACFARDLVNEPLNTLTAMELSKRALSLEKLGVDVTVHDKQAIENLRMGGLLAVNLGSEDPPTFTIMEWKPENAKNSKPLLLVGKGVVFDTGGLSLKPTANSMDLMKSDMGGAAAVLGTMKTVALAKLPLHIIALVPATDNRPGKNAYVPSDIIKMFDGTKVEVLNTDAEGRMILADALAYGKQYKPELCINLATLTGAAAYSIGKPACVGMGNADEPVWKELSQATETSGERIARFPFWKEYQDMIQSDIADIKNIGGPEGGAITAGKFLEHFTDYPFIHLDIAGPAYVTENYQYHPKGGTGFGVRLLAEFLKNRASNA